MARPSAPRGKRIVLVVTRPFMTLPIATRITRGLDEPVYGSATAMRRPSGDQAMPGALLSQRAPWLLRSTFVHRSVATTQTAMAVPA